MWSPLRTGDAGVVHEQPIQPAGHPGGDVRQARLVVVHLADHADLRRREHPLDRRGLDVHQRLGGLGGLEASAQAARLDSFSGISFIPHLGHRPGCGRRTSGCIEQVHHVTAWGFWSAVAAALVPAGAVVVPAWPAGDRPQYRASPIPTPSRIKGRSAECPGELAQHAQCLLEAIVHFGSPRRQCGAARRRANRATGQSRGFALAWPIGFTVRLNERAAPMVPAARGLLTVGRRPMIGSVVKRKQASGYGRAWPPTLPGSGTFDAQPTRPHRPAGRVRMSATSVRAGRGSRGRCRPRRGKCPGRARRGRSARSADRPV